MSNRMKKARVVHSPLEHLFLAETKSIFGLRWKRIDCYSYTDTPNRLPYGPNDSAAEAFKKAIMRCETLMARSVVWQQTNYLREK